MRDRYTGGGVSNLSCVLDFVHPSLLQPAPLPRPLPTPKAVILFPTSPLLLSMHAQPTSTSFPAISCILSVEHLAYFRRFAQTFDEVTILFSDVIGFSTICSRIPPMEIVKLLNRIFTNYDEVTEKHPVYKVRPEVTSSSFDFCVCMCECACVTSIDTV